VSGHHPSFFLRKRTIGSRADKENKEAGSSFQFFSFNVKLILANFVEMGT
jgi:hypothetical protein